METLTEGKRTVQESINDAITKSLNLNPEPQKTEQQIAEEVAAKAASDEAARIENERLEAERIAADQAATEAKRIENETNAVENGKKFFESVPDILKDKLIVPEKKTVVNEPEIKVPEDVTKKLAEYEGKLKDPFIETYLKYKDVEGFDYKKLLKDISGDDGLSDKKYADLVEMEIKKSFPNLTPEEMDEEIKIAISEFDTLSRLQKKEKEDNLRNKLKPMPNQYINQLDEAVKKIAPVDNKAAEQLFQQDLQAITTAANSLKDEVFWGVKNDEKSVNELTQDFLRFQQDPYADFYATDKDGNLLKDGKGKEILDPYKFHFETLKRKNFSRYIEQAVEFGRNEVLKAKANTDTNNKVSNTTVENDTRTDQQKVDADIKERFAIKN